MTIFAKFVILFRQNAKLPLNRMERWSSGLRHTLGKRARLTASAGSNPVLSAKRRLAFVSQNKRNAYTCVPFYFAFFCFVAWSSTTGQFELCIGRVAPSPCFARTNPVLSANGAIAHFVATKGIQSTLYPFFLAIFSC